MIDAWMQICCRHSIDLQDLLKYIPLVFFFLGGGGDVYEFLNNLWRRFCSVHEVGGAQPIKFQVGLLEHLQPSSSPPPLPGSEDVIRPLVTTIFYLAFFVSDPGQFLDLPIISLLEKKITGHMRSSYFIMN